MCKKIVQLVKVIYDLNNKNDQQEYQMSSLVNAYESEISEVPLEPRLHRRISVTDLHPCDQIVQEASSRLNEYRLQIEAKQEEIKQLEHTVKVFRALVSAWQHACLTLVQQQQEQERAQVSEELEQTRKEAAAQTQNLNARVQQLLKWVIRTSQWVQQLFSNADATRREQEEMRVQFEERLKSMSSDSNHLETTHHATINSIKKANQEEVLTRHTCLVVHFWWRDRYR